MKLSGNFACIFYFIFLSAGSLAFSMNKKINKEKQDQILLQRRISALPYDCQWLIARRFLIQAKKREQFLMRNRRIFSMIEARTFN
jgi:hypothetical protein